jgi:hypothetical protein
LLATGNEHTGGRKKAHDDLQIEAVAVAPGAGVGALHPHEVMGARVLPYRQAQPSDPGTLSRICGDVMSDDLETWTISTSARDRQEIEAMAEQDGWSSVGELLVATFKTVRDQGGFEPVTFDDDDDGELDPAERERRDERLVELVKAALA